MTPMTDDPVGDVHMTPTFSRFASTTQPETAFIVLARVRELQAAGKDVIELEIGDSPFATPPNAVEAGVRAIRDGRTHYGPASGCRSFARRHLLTSTRSTPQDHCRQHRRRAGCKDL